MALHSILNHFYLNTAHMQFIPFTLDPLLCSCLCPFGSVFLFWRSLSLFSLFLFFLELIPFLNKIILLYSVFSGNCFLWCLLVMFNAMNKVKIETGFFFCDVHGLRPCFQDILGLGTRLHIYLYIIYFIQHIHICILYMCIYIRHILYTSW